MYRFNESDEAFRAKALEAIQSSVTSYEDQIKAIEVKIKNTLDRLEKQRLQWDLLGHLTNMPGFVIIQPVTIKRLWITV